MALFDFLTEGKPVEAVPVSSTQQTVLPDWYTNYAMDILANQRAVAERPFQAYADETGKPIPRFADFSPDQQKGFQATREGAFTFRPELGTASTKTQDIFGRSGLNAAQPYFNQATGMSGLTAATPGLQQGAGYVAGSTNALGVQMAQPYLQQAGQTAAQTVSQYMNPYEEAVVGRIGALGTRALKEQVLPGIESEMIRAGQFGGTRQAELTGRAIRDAMEGISAQQSAALQQGFGQAQQTAQADLARQAQLASTAGGLGGAQQQALLGAGARMADIGQTYGALTQAQQQLLTDVGKSTGALYGQDTQAQLAAAGQLANIAQQRQTQELAGAGALQQIGAQQQALAQKNLDFAREEWEREQAFPQQQVNSLMGALQGVQPAVPQGATKVGTEVPGAYSPSLLSTIGQAYATYKGLTG